MYHTQARRSRAGRRPEKHANVVCISAHLLVLRPSLRVLKHLKTYTAKTQQTKPQTPTITIKTKTKLRVIMSELTTSQKIAQLEDKIARLRKQDRALENGQKIIIGGMMITLARKDPKSAQRLIELIEQNVTRDVDKKRIEPLIQEFKNPGKPQTTIV